MITRQRWFCFRWKGFGSTRGWLGIAHKDPGSQLVSASGKLEAWWKKFEGRLRRFGAAKNFQWKITPWLPLMTRKSGATYWYSETFTRIFSRGHETRSSGISQNSLRNCRRLQWTSVEFVQTSRRWFVHFDHTYQLLMLLGRSQNILPDDTSLDNDLPITSLYRWSIMLRPCSGRNGVPTFLLV